MPSRHTTYGANGRITAKRQIISDVLGGDRKKYGKIRSAEDVYYLTKKLEEENDERYHIICRKFIEKGLDYGSNEFNDSKRNNANQTIKKTIRKHNRVKDNDDFLRETMALLGVEPSDKPFDWENVNKLCDCVQQIVTQ